MKKECRYWLREYHAKDSRQQLNTEEACEWPQGCKDYETGKCPFYTIGGSQINLRRRYKRMKSTKRLEYEMRQIDAWQEEENCWTWNESWHITNVSIPANVKDLEKALLYRMRKAGIVSKPGCTKLVNIDGSMYELQDRKTGEPLVAFIPVNH